MLLTRTDGALSLRAEAYSLHTAPDRPFVYLHDPAGRRLAELFVLSAVHAVEGRDDCPQTADWQASETDGEVVLALTARSSLWDQKTIRFRCQERRLLYGLEVTGSGRLDEVCYFGGYYSGQVRWGTGFFWSGQRFARGFNPEPNTGEANTFGPAEGSTIDLTGVPLPGKAHWFFTPPPFCLAFQVPGGWLSLGVVAAPGANAFSEYRYHAQRDSFYLSLAYDGQTRVAGPYQLPSIAIDFAGDEYGALEAYVQTLSAAGALPARRAQPQPGWWREPILCGWGAQCFAAAVDHARAPDYARQALYEQWLAALAAQGLEPGSVVIDDKWQASYGDNQVDRLKWPDLRGFVDRQHATGRRVLLWLKAWDPEGLPPDECVTNSAGLPVAADPSSPAYAARLGAAVERMLGPSGYDADGFKIDFTARIPAGPGLRPAGPAWGLELMKRYLGLIYAAAKQAKPEALVMAHTPNPYLADVLDMIRLNDINLGTDIERAMRHRARVAHIACPDALIDTDNWPMADKATWRAYTRLQPELGVPSLYYATHIDSTREALDAGDYALLREIWARYRAGLRQPR